ncbi:MAG TPA: hypothetical protein VJN68_07930 [Burkholderiaceae bacterium]|nr:hypothetical protein [Burkholderiaceae bacterium]
MNRSNAVLGMARTLSSRRVGYKALPHELRDDRATRAMIDRFRGFH